jgi:hypothetical protein
VTSGEEDGHFRERNLLRVREWLGTKVPGRMIQIESDHSSRVNAGHGVECVADRSTC